MTPNYSFSYSDNPSETKPARKVEKGLKRLLIIAGIIIVLQLLWLFVISPFIPFSTIEVNDFEGLSRSEILMLGAIDGTSSFMSTNIKEVQERLAANILVAKAGVTKRFPDRLTISLVPRRAAAVTFGFIDGRQAMIYIDTHGVLYKTADVSSIETDARQSVLPVISGLENPQLYMQLPAGLVSLMENLELLAANSPQLLSAISEIRIEQKAWEGYDFVLYPVHSFVRVRVENNLTEEVIRFMLLMLNVFEGEAEKPVEIDFRSGMGSYKLEEVKEKSLW